MKDNWNDMNKKEKELKMNWNENYNNALNEQWSKMEMDMNRYEQEIIELKEKEKTLSEYVQCLIIEKVALEKQLVQCTHKNNVESSMNDTAARQTPTVDTNNSNSNSNSNGSSNDYAISNWKENEWNDRDRDGKPNVDENLFHELEDLSSAMIPSTPPPDQLMSNDPSLTLDKVLMVDHADELTALKCNEDILDPKNRNHNHNHNHNHNGYNQNNNKPKYTEAYEEYLHLTCAALKIQYPLVDVSSHDLVQMTRSKRLPFWRVYEYLSRYMTERMQWEEKEQKKTCSIKRFHYRGSKRTRHFQTQIQIRFSFFTLFWFKC